MLDGIALAGVTNPTATKTATTAALKIRLIDLVTYADLDIFVPFYSDVLQQHQNEYTKFA